MHSVIYGTNEGYVRIHWQGHVQWWVHVNVVIGIQVPLTDRASFEGDITAPSGSVIICLVICCMEQRSNARSSMAENTIPQ